MFQYALGLSLGTLSKQPIKYDLSWFKNNTTRQLLVDRFKVIIEEASQAEIENSKGVTDGFVYKISRKFGFIKPKVWAETDFGFLPDVMKIKSGSYFKGYWQSFKYFEHIESQVREQFVLSELSKNAIKYIKDVENHTPIGIHIRRGDYLTDKKTNSVHGILDESYYHEAINYFQKQIAYNKLFVFSDDHEAANEIMKNYEGVTIVDGLKDEEELFLFSLCRYQIIANSSFSWWGAWLNSYVDKVIVAPKAWFADLVLNSKTDDLIPNSWHRI